MCTTVHYVCTYTRSCHAYCRDQTTTLHTHNDGGGSTSERDKRRLVNQRARWDGPDRAGNGPHASSSSYFGAAAAAADSSSDFIYCKKIVTQNGMDVRHRSTWYFSRCRPCIDCSKSLRTAVSDSRDLLYLLRNLLDPNIRLAVTIHKDPVFGFVVFFSR